MPRLKKLLTSLAATAALLALSLGAYELYLARFDPDPALLALRSARGGWKWGSLIHRASEVPGLEYELVPGYDGGYKGIKVRINADGMRDDPVRSDHPPDLLRIAVLGDSTTFGLGVAYEHTYTKLLEERLNAAGTSWQYEVLNFGVSGYSTADEAAVLKGKAMRYDPDLVIVAYNLNDPDAERRQPLHRFFGQTHWWQNTHLWRKLDDRRFAHAVKSLGAGDLFRYAHVPGRKNWQSVERGMASMAETVRAAGVPLLLVIFPSGRVGPDPERYRYRDLHRQVAAEAQKNGFKVLDLTPAYARLDRNGLNYLLPDMHPDVRGHGVAAEALANYLLAHHAELLGVPARTE